MTEQSGRAAGLPGVMSEATPANATPLPRRIARWVVVIALVVIGAYLIDLWRAASAEDLVPWRTDAAEARAEARQTGKPMLVLYTAGWCPPCQQLKADSFADPAVADQIAEHYVPLKLDHDRLTAQQAADAAAMGVAALPTLLVLDPAGQPLDRLVGYHDRALVRDWLNHAAASPPATAAR